jgi:hypothetical protein
LHQCARQRQQAAAGERGGNARAAQLGEDLLGQLRVAGQRTGDQAECERSGRGQREQQQFACRGQSGP